MNDRVIVYRSVAEQQQDEFWWSEGWVTATKSGDAILFGAAALVVIFVGLLIWKKISE